MMNNPNNAKSVLRHRQINQTITPPQEGVPLRSRIKTPVRSWQADDQSSVIALPQQRTNRAWSDTRPTGDDIPPRTSAGRSWSGDRPMSNGNTRDDRTWSGKSQPIQADVAVIEKDDQEVAPPVPPTRRQQNAARPAPKTQAQEYVEEEELEVVQPVETEHLKDEEVVVNEEADIYEEESSQYQEPVPMTYSTRRRTSVVLNTLTTPRTTALQQYSPHRFTAPSAPRARARGRVTKERPTVSAQGGRMHWLFPIGIAMVVLLGLYIVCSLVFIWGQDRYNDWTYGTTRTVHLDAVVGDHDSHTQKTHFIGLNLHGRIEVIEFPGGDVTHAKVFVGPQLLWPSPEKAVVTLQVKDVNHDGRPDLVVNVSGAPALFTSTPTFSYVLRNTKDGFQSPALQPVAVA